MASYVYRSEGFGKDVYRYLWADTDDELAMMVSIVDAGPRNPAMQLWTCHDLTEDQLQLALACGAELTDQWGPAFHSAQRRGDVGTIQVILNARRWSKPPAR